MTSSTDHSASARLRRAGPIIGLALTVTIGTLVGVWMAVSAVLTTVRADQAASTAHGHARSPAAAHVDEHAHSAEGVVAMPGLEPVAPALTAADPMAGMSAEDMAVHSSDAHATDSALGESGRPLGATLSGFGVVNLGVLVAAVLIARRRASTRPGRRPPGRQPAHRPATATVGSATSTSDRAGSPS